MTSQNFCYWLQGFFEIQNPEELSEQQVQMIKSHLQLAFRDDIDKRYGDEKHQQKLTEIHWGQQTVRDNC